MRIAGWNGTNWYPLGTGMNLYSYGGPWALAALTDGDLVVGGSFSTAGGAASGFLARWSFGTADFDHDGDSGTDADIEAFFACLAGNCCAMCGSADFNGDGDSGTDADIESFFRVLAGGELLRKVGSGKWEGCSGGAACTEHQFAPPPVPRLEFAHGTAHFQRAAAGGGA